MAYTSHVGRAESWPRNLVPAYTGYGAGEGTVADWLPLSLGWPFAAIWLTRRFPALSLTFGPMLPVTQPPSVVVEGGLGPSLADVRFARCPTAWVLDPLPIPQAAPPDGLPWSAVAPDGFSPDLQWLDAGGKPFTATVEPVAPPAEAATLGWVPQIPVGVWTVTAGHRASPGVGPGALADPVTTVEPIVWEPLLPSVPPAPRPLRRVSAGETAFLEPVVNISRMAWWSVVIGVSRPRRTVWEGAAGGAVLRPPSLGFGASTDVVYLGHEFVASPALVDEYLGD